MKKVIYFLLILNLGLLSCVDDASVRVMPEFNWKYYSGYYLLSQK